MATSPPTPDAPEPRRQRNPWWIPPFFGRVPDLEPRLLSLLGLVALGMVFEQYDLSLINSALKHIADDLDIATADTGFYLGAIRLGGFLTFAIAPFADRIGRRRVFLVSLVGMSVGTLATGLCQTAVQFVVMQTITRGFLLTAVAVAIVIVVEEFPAEHRGWAIGMFSAVGALGYGLGAALFAAIDVLPYGWRALYAFGITPVLVLPLLRRNLPETRRFEQHRSQHAEETSWWVSVRGLTRSQPRRVVALGLAGMLMAAGHIAVFQYSSLYVQRAHGWAPWQYSLMILCGGLIGVGGHIVAGRVADRVGRRTVGAVFLALFPLGAGLFYLGPTWVLVPAFAIFVFCNAAGEVIVRAFAGELFPTSQRGASTGGLVLVQTIGWSLGLFTVGLATTTERVDQLATAVAAVALAAAAAGACLLALPESGRRELEAINAEDETPAVAPAGAEDLA